MDLLDFEGQAMYFDEPMPEGVSELIDKAAEEYAEGTAEHPLLQAYFYAPRSLTVLVALYRFYYYQHRLADAILVAHRAMDEACHLMGMHKRWKEITEVDLGAAVLQSMGLVRFFLMALKGAGYLSLRLGRLKEGVDMLGKVVYLDPKDYLHARSLYDMACEAATVGDNKDVRSIHGYHETNNERMSA